MLHELQIENYAVVEKLRVRFRPGLNLLTGETGSGKSIVVDALSLLFGARASGEVIRAGSERCRVSGIFELAPSPALSSLLESAGLGLEDGELIAEREILSSGKSRTYLNGRPATLSVLKELAPHLGDIHGQHEQQQLFSAAAQREMLDEFAAPRAELDRLAGVYRRWRDCRRRLDELRGDEQDRLRRLDLYLFQRDEILQAGLEPGEDARLSEQKRLLENIVRVEESAASAYDLLYDSASSVTTQLTFARRSVEELSRYESSFTQVVETIENARAALDDAALEIRRFQDGLEADPQRLEQIEDRLALIEKLRRKYGATLDDVIAYGEEAARQVDELESSDAAVAETEKRMEEAAAEYRALAAEVSKRRKAAAKKLQAAVEKELASLAMEGARFEVEVTPQPEDPAAWTAHGVDRVRFLVSANPGQPPRPLAQVASGGELSRITLALKVCLLRPGAPVKSGPPRTLVFDEIDAGVGGSVAEALGRRLDRLARGHQVLCVTHLPQIAGFADAHYFVAKQERNGAAYASLEELSEAQRVQELARMLSGSKVTAAAQKHARQLLKAGRENAG